VQDEVGNRLVSVGDEIVETTDYANDMVFLGEPG
jgi:hypothetical protein